MHERLFLLTRIMLMASNRLRKEGICFKDATVNLMKSKVNIAAGCGLWEPVLMT